MDCETCQLVAARDAGGVPDWDAIVRTDYFDVVHAYNSTLLGWVVLVLRRHAAALDELTEMEAEQLGRLIRHTSVGLKATTGCEKTYVMQFAESAGHNHVHIHVVPRDPAMPADHRGINVFKYLGASEEKRIDEDVMNAFALQMREYLTSPPLSQSSEV